MKPKKYKLSIQEIYIYLYSVGIFTPIILNKYLIYIVLVGLLFWAFTLKVWYKCLLKYKLLYWCTILFFIEMIYRFSGISTGALGNYILRFLSYISIWMGIYIFKYLNFKKHWQIVNFSILVIILNLINNINIYNKYPELRASGMLENINYLRSKGIWNLGTTFFSYVILFLAIFSFCMFFMKKYNSKKYLWFIVFITSSIYILFYTGSGTVIISFLVSICCIYFFIKLKKASIYIVMCLILSLIFINVCNEFFINLIFELRPILGEKVVIRLIVVLKLLANDKKLNYTYLSRFNFLMYDLEVWVLNIKNFLIGKGYHTYSGVDVVDALIKNKDGGHSGFVDLIPRYGLLGLITCLNIIRSGFYLRKYCEYRIEYKIFIIVYIVFIINNILNNIMVAGVIFILLVFYSLILLVKEKKVK